MPFVAKLRPLAVLGETCRLSFAYVSADGTAVWLEDLDFADGLTLVVAGYRLGDISPDGICMPEAEPLFAFLVDKVKVVGIAALVARLQEAIESTMPDCVEIMSYVAGSDTQPIVRRARACELHVCGIEYDER